MTGEESISGAERQGRRRRLRIILVVVVVVVVGFAITDVVVNRHDATRTRQATTELETKLRGVNVSELQQRYAISSTQALDDTAAGPVEVPGLPEMTHAQWRSIGWPAPETLVGRYEVNGTRIDRCLQVTVTGPAPNKVEVRKTSC